VVLHDIYFSAVCLPQVLQQQGGMQIVAQQGLNGQITYNAVPQFQMVTLDGQQHLQQVTQVLANQWNLRFLIQFILNVLAV